MRWTDVLHLGSISRLSCEPLFLKWSISIGLVTARVRSTTGRYCFHRCLSVHRGGGGSGYPPPEGGTRTPPGTWPGTPPGGGYPVRYPGGVPVRYPPGGGGVPGPPGGVPDWVPPHPRVPPHLVRYPGGSGYPPRGVPGQVPGGVRVSPRGVPGQVPRPPRGGGTWPGTLPPPRGVPRPPRVPDRVPPGGYPDPRGTWPGTPRGGTQTPPGYLTGYPPRGGVPGPPGGGGTQLGQHREYLLHSGRYASCVHAGGLSCIDTIFINLTCTNELARYKIIRTMQK